MLNVIFKFVRERVCVFLFRCMLYISFCEINFVVFFSFVFSRLNCIERKKVISHYLNQFEPGWCSFLCNNDLAHSNICLVSSNALSTLSFASFNTSRPISKTYLFQVKHEGTCLDKDIRFGHRKT